MCYAPAYLLNSGANESKNWLWCGALNPMEFLMQSADVDIFILRVTRRAKTSAAKSVQWTNAPVQTDITVGDYFDVQLPCRAASRQEKWTQMCLHSRASVPTWMVMKKFTETLRHKGPAYKPPFVVIRRTSRPGDAYRATATVISSKSPIAVENHLIVCEPKDGKLTTCKELMLQLKSDAVNKYLNARIRCRHLTVKAIKEAPMDKRAWPKR